MVWTDKSKGKDFTRDDNTHYLIIYAILAIGVAVGALIRVSVI